jgi:hypothetical protein
MAARTERRLGGAKPAIAAAPVFLIDADVRRTGGAQAHLML